LTLRVHQCRDNAESAPPVRAMQTPTKMIKKLSDLGRHAAMVRFGGFCITLRYIAFAKLAFDPSWICLGSLTYFFC
jgi:hypothetical protein